MRHITYVTLLVSLLLALAAPADAVTVNPTGVNVRQMGPSTAFLTFRALLPTQSAAEGLWCGELLITGACDPTTIFGRMPARLDRSQTSGVGNFTDIMSIPPSVTRRAYQAAASGSASQFFYVRRFTNTVGPDEFVAVTCRMAGGGSNSPLAITEIKLAFDEERPVLYVPRNTPPTPLHATIQYNGTGRLKGRWEVVMPGDPAPTATDLLPEAALPVGARAGRHRYTLLQRFDVFLPPKGKHVLQGPDPSRLPHKQDGLYLILLRIEASDASQSRSNQGVFEVQAGGVAGFEIPPLRYYMGTGEQDSDVAAQAAKRSLRALEPRPGQHIPSTHPVRFRWIGDSRAALHTLEVREGKDVVLSALVDAGSSTYTAPPFLRDRAGATLEWRVIAIDDDGDSLARSEWSEFGIDSTD
jgi:hypothetical protein